LEDGVVEFGFSAFEDGKLCVLSSCHSIRSPERSVKEKITAELAYYINWDCFLALNPRKNVSAGRNAQRNLFSETLFIQNLSFDGAALVLGNFFAVFLRGVFGMPKRFAECISEAGNR